MIVARGVCLVVGVCLLFYVFFSYEDEEQRVRSWLEGSWSTLRSAEHRLSARINGLLRSLANASSLSLDRAYGVPLLSARAIAAPLCFTTGVYILLQLVPMTSSVLEKFIFIAAALLLGFLPFVMQGKLALPLGLIVTVFFASMAIVERINIPPNSDGFLAHIAENIAIVLAVGVVFDCACIVAVRALLRRASSSASLKVSVLLLFLSTLIAPVTIYLLVPVMEELFPYGLEWDVLLVQFSLVALLTSVVFLAALTLSTVLHLAMSMAPRMIHSVAKLKMLENRKAAGAAGALFIGVWSPESLGRLEKVLKAVIG